MLTPVVAATDAAEPPIDWTPMKWLTTASLFGALALLLAHERRRLPEPLLWLVLGWVALNPLLYDFRDAVLSELPFLLFVAASLWLADRRSGGAAAPGNAGGPARSIGTGVALGVLLYLAYGTRSVGAASTATGSSPKQRGSGARCSCRSAMTVRCSVTSSCRSTQAPKWQRRSSNASACPTSTS